MDKKLRGYESTFGYFNIQAHEGIRALFFPTKNCFKGASLNLKLSCYYRPDFDPQRASVEMYVLR